MIRINELKMPVEHNDELILGSIIKTLGVSASKVLSYSIVKKSIDARKKPEVIISYMVDVQVDADEASLVKKLRNNKISVVTPKKYSFAAKAPEGERPPVIVGMGPAGLFAGLFLARWGYKPIIVERGEDVDSRVETVSLFWQGGNLDANSNVQFGEGGAGTFSDGKLNTMVKDKFLRNRLVLETFVEMGAPERILYEGKPHIGTDILTKVVKNMREEIIALGGQVKFRTQMTGLICDKSDRVLRGILVKDNNGAETEILADKVILAIGHSARDTFYMLNDERVAMEAKSFAVGVRVEHPQKMISLSQYGEKYCDVLPPAPYKVTANLPNGRGVYSFCMCPGGYVVNASSEEGMLAVNGMSYSDRSSENANSAIIVTVNKEDFVKSADYSEQECSGEYADRLRTGEIKASDIALCGLEFQRNLERRAFEAGNGKIPVQTLEDFENDRETVSFGNVIPCTKGEIAKANLRAVLPEFINESLIAGMHEFGKKIKGFDAPDVTMLGVESRTSSPVRILRDEKFESNIKGLFPCGEGAGYAGGITSAAMDGIKVAEAVASS